MMQLMGGSKKAEGKRRRSSKFNPRETNPLGARCAMGERWWTVGMRRCEEEESEKKKKKKQKKKKRSKVWGERTRTRRR
jgi:hypothetical protein